MKGSRHASGTAPRDIGSHRVCAGIAATASAAEAVVNALGLEFALTAHAWARADLILKVHCPLQIPTIARSRNDKGGATGDRISHWIQHHIAALAHMLDGVFWACWFWRVR